MKRNVVLISNWGNNLTGHGASGETKTAGAQKAFDMLCLALEEIDVAIVEALTHTRPAAPVIALVDGDDAKAMTELHQHGAAACLKKPFCADELARLIEAVCASASNRDSSSCDQWGHVCASCRGKPRSD